MKCNFSFRTLNTTIYSRTVSVCMCDGKMENWMDGGKYMQLSDWCIKLGMLFKMRSRNCSVRRWGLLGLGYRVLGVG